MVLQTEFAQIKNNNLYIDEIKATDLVEKYGTPLYVMSEGHIRQQFNTLKTKMLEKYENTLPLFASKSFSCLAIYKIAKEYGIGIDCVSAGEISIALKAGFDPKKIYFHGNNKLPSEIEYALSHGVENLVIDNFYEIELVQEIAKKLNIVVNGVIRITPGVYAGGHDYIRVGAKDTKFGFSSHDNTYLKAIKKVIDASNIDESNTVSLDVKATAYAGDTITSTGTVPTEGTTIAVDPSVIPYGSKVYIPGYGMAIAADTGGAIKGNKIDLFLNSENDCINWGVQTVSLYIIAYPGEW